VNDLYADTILPNASLLADVDTDPHVAANSPDAVYG